MWCVYELYMRANICYRLECISNGWKGCVCVWSTEKTYIRNLRCGLTERSDAWRVRVFGQKSTAIYPLSTIETPLMRVRVYCVYVSIYFLPVLFPTANRLESRAPSNAKETKAAKRQNWLWVIYFHFCRPTAKHGIFHISACEACLVARYSYIRYTRHTWASWHTTYKLVPKAHPNHTRRTARDLPCKGDYS